MDLNTGYFTVECIHDYYPISGNRYFKVRLLLGDSQQLVIQTIDSRRGGGGKTTEKSYGKPLFGLLLGPSSSDQPILSDML